MFRNITKHCGDGLNLVSEFLDGPGPLATLHKMSTQMLMVIRWETVVNQPVEELVQHPASRMHPDVLQIKLRRLSGEERGQTAHLFLRIKVQS